MRRPRPLEPAQGMALGEKRPQKQQHGQGKGVIPLTVTVSAALLLTATVFLLCRYARLRIWHAAVCIILGFYLASTSLAPYISRLTESLFSKL
jgi:hypothetical protein